MQLQMDDLAARLLPPLLDLKEDSKAQPVAASRNTTDCKANAPTKRSTRRAPPPPPPLLSPAPTPAPSPPRVAVARLVVVTHRAPHQVAGRPVSPSRCRQRRRRRDAQRNTMPRRRRRRRARRRFGVALKLRAPGPEARAALAPAPHPITPHPPHPPHALTHTHPIPDRGALAPRRPPRPLARRTRRRRRPAAVRNAALGPFNLVQLDGRVPAALFNVPGPEAPLALLPSGRRSPRRPPRARAASRGSPPRRRRGPPRRRRSRRSTRPA